MSRLVIYPGPAVSPARRETESYHVASGTHLKPGTVEVADDAQAERMIAAGLVIPAPKPRAAHPPTPTPTPTLEAEPEPTEPETSRRRRRSAPTHEEE